MNRALAVAAGAILSWALPASPVRADGLQTDVDQAAAIIARFGDMPEKGIPDAVMRKARGVAVLTVFKAGFGLSGQGGKGLVIARTASGWTGPSAIATGGAGFGFQIGAEITEFVIILNTSEAVNAFARGGNVTIGADLSVAAGPVGRNLAAGVMPMAAIYTYSLSQGLFAGMSLQGAVIVTRDASNREFYGRAITPAEILSGKVEAPAGASKLIDALKRY